MKVLEVMLKNDPKTEKKVHWFSKNVSPTCPVHILLWTLLYSHCNGEKQTYKLFSFDHCVVIKDSISLVACLTAWKQKAFPYSLSASFLLQHLHSVSQAPHQAARGDWLCHCNTLLIGSGLLLLGPQSCLFSGWTVQFTQSLLTALLTLTRWLSNGLVRGCWCFSCIRKGGQNLTQ